MKTINGTIEELVSWLDAEGRGNIIVGISSKNSVPTLKKNRVTGQPFNGEIVRESYRTYSLGIIYANAVNTANTRAAEQVCDILGVDASAADEIEYFNPAALWQRKDGTSAAERVNKYVVQHKETGRLYVAGRPHQTGEKVLADRWTLNGVEIDPKDYADVMPIPSKSYCDITVAGVAVAVAKPPYRTQSLDSLVALNWKGITFKIM